MDVGKTLHTERKNHLQRQNTRVGNKHRLEKE